MSSAIPLLGAFVASALVAITLVRTQRAHGHLSHDSDAGVQKVHAKPTPRVGGVAIATGLILGGLLMPKTDEALWWGLCLSALPAFAAGLWEDLTKNARARWRLAATVFAGLLFSAVTGYRIASLDFSVADLLLSSLWISIPFTAFAIGGIANAINLIDGVNGLASGSSIIILIGYAIVAVGVGDTEIVTFCLLNLGALGGFFVLNFPFGRIFLGDAGAYLTGFVLAAIAVMLPMRNPELSPLLGLLALSYPVIETMVSIHRRTVRKGTHPGKADRLHLHSLVYRDLARRLARFLRVPGLRNAMTSILLWNMAALSTALTVLFSHDTALILLGLGIMFAVYLVLYRRVALLVPAPERAPAIASSRKVRASDH